MATTSLPILLSRATTSSGSKLLVRPIRPIISYNSRPAVSCISHHQHLLVSEHHHHVVVAVPNTNININIAHTNIHSRQKRNLALVPSSSSSPLCYQYQTRFINVTVTHSSNTDNEEKNDHLIGGGDSASSSSSSPPSPNNDNGITITASCVARIKQLASTRPNPDSIYLRLFVDAGGCSGFQYKFLLLSSEVDSDRNNNSNSHNNSSSISSNQDNENEGEEKEDGTIDPEEDIIFYKDGVRVVIDSTSLELLRGSTIDYVSEMIRSSFAVVNNPQSESACGCGSSFAAKNFGMNPALD